MYRDSRLLETLISGPSDLVPETYPVRNAQGRPSRTSYFGATIRLCHFDPSFRLWSRPPYFAQTAPNAEQLAQQFTRMHDAWGVRASSPNMALSIVQQSHTGTEFRYCLQATGIPADSVVTLVSWPVTQRGPAEVLRGVTFNDMGFAVCAGRPALAGTLQNRMI